MQGSIRKRVHQTKDGKTTTNWYVVLDAGRDADGKRRQKYHGAYRTRKEAEAARAKLVHDRHNGSYVAPSSLTVADWIRERWLPTMKTQLKATTWESYRRMMELHVLPTIGGRTLVQVTPLMLNALYAELAEHGNRRGNTPGGLHAKTIRSIHNSLHKAFADAIDAGLLAVNPVERAKPPRLKTANSREMTVWDGAQLACFLESVKGSRLEAAFRLAATTGMRRGEVLGLRWRDIDFDANRLAVRHTIVSVGYEVRSSTPKSHQARTIDLDEHTIEVLVAHRARQQSEKDEWGRDYEDNDLVFCRENGTPLHPMSMSQHFERAVARAGMPLIRLHDLRHTHATIA